MINTRSKQQSPTQFVWLTIERGSLQILATNIENLSKVNSKGAFHSLIFSYFILWGVLSNLSIVRIQKYWDTLYFCPNIVTSHFKIMRHLLAPVPRTFGQDYNPDQKSWDTALLPGQYGLSVHLPLPTTTAKYNKTMLRRGLDILNDDFPFHNNASPSIPRTFSQNSWNWTGTSLQLRLMLNAKQSALEIRSNFFSFFLHGSRKL